MVQPELLTDEIRWKLTDPSENVGFPYLTKKTMSSSFLKIHRSSHLCKTPTCCKWPPSYLRMGGTGCGKSRLSIDLAATLGLQCEIINSDKMQVFEVLDINPSKITAQDSRGVPHHLAISDIVSRGKLPFLVGDSNSSINIIRLLCCNTKLNVLLLGDFDPKNGELFPSNFRFYADLAISDIASTGNLPLLVVNQLSVLGSKIECADLMQISDESVRSNSLGSNEMGVDGGDGYPEPMDIDGDDVGGNEGDGDDRGGGGDNDGDEYNNDEFIPLDFIPIYKRSPNLPLTRLVGHVQRNSVSTFYTFLFELCKAWAAYSNLRNYITDQFNLQEIWPNHRIKYFGIIDSSLVSMHLNGELEGDEWERFFSSLRYIEVERIS